MSLTPKLIWAYSYRLAPPRGAAKLRALRTLLGEVNNASLTDAGMFQGRLVVGGRIAHILVLSDSPELDREVNRRIEAELHTLDATFSVTVPLAVSDHGGPPE